MQQIEVSRIEPDANNVRVVKATPGQEDSLIASMKAIGLLSPIHVTPIEGDRFRVVAGHRRFQAARDLRWDTIPCLVVNATTNLTLIQASENMVRADMHPLDVWLAVERMVVEQGMTPPAVALALNVSEKRVRHLVAMSSLHPKIVAHIRKHPTDMPDERHVRVICQAPLDKQAKAFTEHGGTWWRLASALTAKGMLRSAVRFDIASYTGPVHRDLFDDEATELLTDMDQALRLQTEWLDAERRRWIGLGFQAAVIERDQWGSIKPPPGAVKDTWQRKDTKARIKKAERSRWIYGACLDGDGAVIDYLFPVKPEAKAQAAAAEATAEVAAPVTKKGAETIDQAQRDALANWIESFAETDMLMLAAAVCLMEQDSKWLDAEVLFADDGSLRCDVTVDTIKALLSHAIGTLVRKRGYNTPISAPIVHRLGALMQVVPTLAATADNLAMLKKPALARILSHAGKSMADFTSQGRARDFIVKQMGDADRALIPHELPALAWDPTQDLPYSWRRRHAYGADTDEGDEADDLSDGGEEQDEAA
jgi:ParB/RepB/Spo0J family partition protein